MIRITEPGTVGAVVADLRAMGRLTQRELCAQVGMDPARLSDWETGRAVPTLPYLLPVLDVLGYQVHIAPGPDDERRPTGTGWPA